MGVRLPNERMDASDPALPVFETKGERTIASSANQPGGTGGMVLPWLMTMPSPSEDIKIGNIGARWDKKLETAQPFSVPEGPTPATQLVPMPEGPSSVSPEFSTTGEDGTVPSHPGKPGVIAPWLSMSPSRRRHLREAKSHRDQGRSEAAIAYCRAREWELSFCAGELCGKA